MKLLSEDTRTPLRANHTGKVTEYVLFSIVLPVMEDHWTRFEVTLNIANLFTVIRRVKRDISLKFHNVPEVLIVCNTEEAGIVFAHVLTLFHNLKQAIVVKKLSFYR